MTIVDIIYYMVIMSALTIVGIFLDTLGDDLPDWMHMSIPAILAAGWILLISSAVNVI